MICLGLVLYAGMMQTRCDHLPFIKGWLCDRAKTARYVSASREIAKWFAGIYPCAGASAPHFPVHYKYLVSYATWLLGCDTSVLRTGQQRIDGLKHVSGHYIVTILYLTAGFSIHTLLSVPASTIDGSSTGRLNPLATHYRLDSGVQDHSFQRSLV